MRSLGLAQLVALLALVPPAPPAPVCPQCLQPLKVHPGDPRAYVTHDHGSGFAS